MIKLLLLTLPFLVVYMAFAFVNWDIAWAAHVDMNARWFFVLILASCYSVLGICYLYDN